MAITHSVKFTASAKDAISEIQRYEDRIVATAQTVDKHASSLGGGKILAQANNWTAAVAKLGGATGDLIKQEQLLAGVSKMTASDQEKVNSAIAKALPYYEAMGQQAPTAMLDLYEQTKKIPGETDKIQGGLSGIMSKLGPLGGMVAGAFSIGAVSSFVSSVLTSADHIQKLADQTGMTAVQVQRLQHVGEQTGVGLDAMAKAVQTLQQRLGEGNEGAAGAMRRLGINTEAFLQLGPYEQFMTLAEGIGGIRAPTDRAATAAQIFGDTWKELAPALIEDLRRIAAEASTMSDQTVAKLDKIGDTYARFKQGLAVGAGEVIVGIQGVGEAMRDLGPVGGASLLGLNAAMDLLASSAPPVENAVKRLSSDGLKPLTMSMLDAERIGRELTDSVKASIEVNTAAAKATKDWDSALESMSRTTHLLAVKMGQDAVSAANKMKDAINASVVSQLSTLEEYRQKNELAELSGTELQLRQIEIRKEAAIRAAGERHGVEGGLYDMAIQQIEIFFARERAAVEAGTQQITTHATAVQKLGSSWQQASKALSWSDAMTAVGQGKGTMSGQIQNGPMDRNAIQQAWEAGNYYGPVANGNQANPRGSGPDWAKLGLPARAEGGPVTAGVPYLVGERGPEVFVPSRSGGIVPNGGGNIEVTIAPGAVVVTQHYPIMNDPRAADALAAVVADGLLRRLKGQGVRFPGA